MPFVGSAREQAVPAFIGSRHNARFRPVAQQLQRSDEHSRIGAGQIRGPEGLCIPLENDIRIADDQRVRPRALLACARREVKPVIVEKSHASDQQIRPDSPQELAPFLERGGGEDGEAGVFEQLTSFVPRLCGHLHDNGGQAHAGQLLFAVMTTRTSFVYGMGTPLRSAGRYFHLFAAVSRSRSYIK